MRGPERLVVCPKHPSRCTIGSETIAQGLGVKEVGGQPLREILQEALRARQLLLVLDNVEQVLAAPLVGDLQAACLGLTVLVTSRAPLRVQGEQEYLVPPLVVPDPQQLPPLEVLTQYDAVRLFIARAQQVKADFAVTNQTAPAVAAIYTGGGSCAAAHRHRPCRQTRAARWPPLPPRHDAGVADTGTQRRPPAPQARPGSLHADHNARADAGRPHHPRSATPILHPTMCRPIHSYPVVSAAVCVLTRARTSSRRHAGHQGHGRERAERLA
jgi:hypothetical protein